MSPLRQGFSWWCFENRGADAETLLAHAARIGHEYVDLIEEPLWPEVHAHGLQLGAISGHQAINDGLNRRENAARIEAELFNSLEKAVQWRIPVLICFSGNRSEADSERSLMQCAETLSRVAPAAEKAGVTLAMELLNSKIDHPGYQCDSTAWGLRLCEQTGSPAVKLLYDIYHMQIMEGDIIRTIQKHHTAFAHYHTAGNPGRGLPDENQEINYKAIYRTIAATGSNQIISHEFLPLGDPLFALEKAFRDCVKATAPI